MNITINDDIAKKIEERVKQSQEFSSVEQYVNYILAEVIKHTSSAAADSKSDDAYTKEQEQEVKKRLEDLGYLD